MIKLLTRSGIASCSGASSRWRIASQLGLCSLSRPVHTASPTSAGSRRTWRHAEDELLLKMRADGLRPRDIHAALPGRTLKAVEDRFHSLKYGEKSSRQPWTAAENELLIKLTAEGLPPDDIYASFPGRASKTVQKRWHNLKRGRGLVQQLKAPYAPFTEEEDTIIREMRAKGRPFKQIAAAMPLRRSPGSVRHRFVARQHAAANPTGFQLSGHIWSEQETAKLVHLREELRLSWEEVCARMPHRSYAALGMALHIFKRRTLGTWHKG